LCGGLEIDIGFASKQRAHDQEIPIGIGLETDDHSGLREQLTRSHRNHFGMDKLTCVEAMVEQVLTCRRFRADRRRRAVALVIVLNVILGVRAWSAPPSSEMPISQLPMATPEVQEPIVPLPLTIDQNPAKVALGEHLFHDVRLSRDNSMSCATCHQLEQGGDDGLPRSMTVTGTSLSRNAPTVVALNSSFNWDCTVAYGPGSTARYAVRTIPSMIEGLVRDGGSMESDSNLSQNCLSRIAIVAR
jgi:hypothetical protein